MATQPLGKILISMAGLIAAGKTSLATELSEIFGLELFKEPVEDNELLPAFYNDIKGMSFQYQIDLLAARYVLQSRAIWGEKGGIIDRSIDEDGVFVSSLLKQDLITKSQAETYGKIFNIMSNQLRNPNLIIFLDVSPEISFQRIQSRGRECEKGITLEYLQALYEEYQAFIRRVSKVTRVITVPWNEFVSPKEVAALLYKTYLETGTNLIELDLSSISSSRPQQEEEEEEKGGSPTDVSDKYTHTEGLSLIEHDVSV